MIGRRVLRLLAAALVALGIQAGSPSPSNAYTQITANVEFYDALNPYGRWVHVSRYGDCWVPLDTPVGWRPYSVGYWVDTDYGWMWVSQDPWGELPYHYGRWYFDHNYYGWVWVPDDDEVWAPAWVTWRYGNEYVGWAPLPPEAEWGGSGLVVSASFIESRISRSSWCFTPIRSFGTTRLRSTLLPPSRSVTLLARTRNVTRYQVYNSLPAERGLNTEVIERATGRKFQRYRVVDSRSPNFKRVAIQGRTIEAYRPKIVGAKSRRARFAPAVERRSSRAMVQRQTSEQRRFDQRMGQEKSALEREHRREQGRSSRERVQAEMRNRQQAEIRGRHQAELRAHQDREAQERRSLERRRRVAEEMERGQGRGQGQDQTSDRGRERTRERQDRGRDQGQDRGKAQDQDKERNQDDREKDRGRGRGRGN